MRRRRHCFTLLSAVPLLFDLLATTLACPIPSLFIRVWHTPWNSLPLSEQMRLICSELVAATLPSHAAEILSTRHGQFHYEAERRFGLMPLEAGMALHNSTSPKHTAPRPHFATRLVLHFLRWLGPALLCMCSVGRRDEEGVYNNQRKWNCVPGLRIHSGDYWCNSERGSGYLVHLPSRFRGKVLPGQSSRRCSLLAHAP